MYFVSCSAASAGQISAKKHLNGEILPFHSSQSCTQVGKWGVSAVMATRVLQFTSWICRYRLDTCWFFQKCLKLNGFDLYFKLFLFIAFAMNCALRLSLSPVLSINSLPSSLIHLHFSSHLFFLFCQTPPYSYMSFLFC